MNVKVTHRKAIIIVAIIVSLFLYLAGVFSGLYANKIFEERTEQNLNLIREESRRNLGFLKSETQEDLDLLRKYIEILDHKQYNKLFGYKKK